MKSEFSDMQTIIDAYTFINKRPSIHGQAEARFMARAGPGSYSVGRQFFNLERQDTKGPRAYVVNEARMSMKHKLVDSPGYEMYNQFILNLPDDKKPFFEDLQPMTNEEYKMHLKATLERAAQEKAYKKVMTDFRPSSKKAVQAQLSRKQTNFNKDIRDRQTTQNLARISAVNNPTLFSGPVLYDVHNFIKRGTTGDISIKRVFMQQQRLTAGKRQSSFGAGTSAPNDPSHSGYFL